MASKSRSRRSKGTVRRLKSGRYQAGYKPHPGAKYLWAPETFRLKGEADEWLRGIYTDLSRGDWIDPNLALVEFEAYAREWVRTRKLKDSTRAKYLDILERHAFPSSSRGGLGDVALGHVRAETIRRWRATLGHIPSTQARTYALVKSIFATAVTDGRIKSNPCSVPGADRYDVPEREPAVQDLILQAATLMREQYRVWVLLACWGGMRRGELLGLRRRQIDVETQTIRIGPTRVEVGGTYVDQDTGKSTRAKRPIVLPKLIMDCLVAHLERFVDDDPNARVFTGVRDRSKPARMRTVYADWYAARKAIGRPGLTMHDLRHSGNTIQSSHGGASLAERMSFFGWSRSEVADRYDHTVDGRHAEIAGRLNDQLAGSNVVDLFPRQSHEDRTAAAGDA